jgi:hypothetical protein
MDDRGYDGHQRRSARHAFHVGGAYAALCALLERGMVGRRLENKFASYAQASR